MHLKVILNVGIGVSAFSLAVKRPIKDIEIPSWKKPGFSTCLWRLILALYFLHILGDSSDGTNNIVSALHM